jgi:hypothetical protein
MWKGDALQQDGHKAAVQTVADMLGFKQYQRQ